MSFPIPFPDPLPVQIEPCPIVESIFEMRFAANEPWATLPGLLYAQVRARYREQKALPLAELPEEMRRHDPALAHLPLLQFISPDFLIQLGPRVVGLATRANAYPGWPRIKEELHWLLPLIEAGAVDVDHLIADAKSGVSGAGRKTELNLMYAEASDNFAAYGVGGHRHWPEIRQGLAQAAGREVGLVFIPHLTPMIRGIHATLYGRIAKEMDFQALYEKRYANEPFVDVMPAGSHPDTRSTRAANVCRIAVHRPPEHSGRRDTLVVLAVIDNLMKGASGQAVQNMNLMFGLPETAGLEQAAVVP